MGKWRNDGEDLNDARTPQDHDRFFSGKGLPAARLAAERRLAHAWEEPLEASLALAHLLKHVMIDGPAFITSAPLVSVITGAHKDSTRRFDIFVECTDPSLAPLVVWLAASWLPAALDGTPLDGAGRPALDLVRVLYQKRPEPLPVEDLAAQLGPILPSRRTTARATTRPLVQGRSF